MDQSIAELLVTDMHSFFSDWFSGKVERSALADFESRLDPEFTIINPDGSRSTLHDVLGQMNDGYGTAPDLVVEAEDYVFVAGTAELEVASYVEVQRWSAGANKRRTTATFVQRGGSPRGWVMRQAHETWLEAPATQQA